MTEEHASDPPPTVPDPDGRFAPLVHPRRDPVLRGARFFAALVCAVVNSMLFLAVFMAIEADIPLTPWSLALLAIGFLLIATRVSLLVELALAVRDHAERLVYVPQGREVVARFAVGVLLPWAIMATALSRLDSFEIAFWCLIAVLILEFIYRFGGYMRWRLQPIDTEVLKALLAGNASNGVLALMRLESLTPRRFEVNALAVAGRAMRESDRQALRMLLGVAERFLEKLPVPAEEREAAERTLLLVDADLARLEDANLSAEKEARALRLTPPGHPRRLSLALFVATAALESDQPEAAIKALSRLHTRDVMTTGGRVVVNWLLGEAARRVGDTQLAERCARALATFNVRAEAESIRVDNLKEDHSPYARWLIRARNALVATPKP